MFSGQLTNAHLLWWQLTDRSCGPLEGFFTPVSGESLSPVGSLSLLLPQLQTGQADGAWGKPSGWFPGALAGKGGRLQPAGCWKAGRQWHRRSCAPERTYLGHERALRPEQPGREASPRLGWKRAKPGRGWERPGGRVLWGNMGWVLVLSDLCSGCLLRVTPPCLLFQQKLQHVPLCLWAPRMLEHPTLYLGPLLPALGPGAGQPHPWIGHSLGCRWSPSFMLCLPWAPRRTQVPETYLSSNRTTWKD